MALATLLLVASLSHAAGAHQTPQTVHEREQTVSLTKEQIARIVEKRKSIRSRVDGRRKAAETKFDGARKAFMTNQQATLDEANRKALERIKLGK